MATEAALREFTNIPLIACMMLRKQKVLAGEVPSSIPAATPCKVLYSVSLNTTRQMKIDLPEQLVRGAHQAY